MAKGNPNPPPPPKEFQFKKGVAANPLGINISVEERAFRTLTKKELVKIGNEIVQSSYEELLEFEKDRKRSGIHRMVIAQALKAIESRDTQAFDMLLNRLIGKVRDEVLHQGDMLTPPQIILTLPDNGSSVRTIDAEVKTLPEDSDDDIDMGF